MILELDCGNSLIKWRVLAESQLVTAQGVVQDSDELLAAVVAESPLSITFVRMVSVRSEEEINQLVDLLGEVQAVARIPQVMDQPGTGSCECALT